MDFKIPDWLSYEIQRRWERLAVRGWVNKNPRIIIGVMCVSVFVLLLIVIDLSSGGEDVKVEDYKKGWFYDLNAGELFTAKSDLVPPIEAPSGPLPNGEPAGVRAYVFSFAYEPNESNRFVGFLETTDPNYHKEDAESGKPGGGGAQPWGIRANTMVQAIPP